MFKKIFSLITVSVLSIVGTLVAVGGDSNTSVVIHGHVNEEIYEVQVDNNQLESFLSESGSFECDNNMCHIEY